MALLKNAVWCGSDSNLVCLTVKNIFPHKLHIFFPCVDLVQLETSHSVLLKQNDLMCTFKPDH